MYSVFVFVDNSNIWVSGQDVCEKREGFTEVPFLRLYLNNLKLLAGCNRPNVKYRIFGSKTATSNAIFHWTADSSEDLTVTMYERGMYSETEQAVDEAIQLEMYRTMVTQDEPGVAVLLSGDGKGFEEGVGFTKALYDMHNQGWGIEVLSWEGSCHRALREFAEQNGVFVPLDAYYDEITYLKDNRYAKPLSLRNRKTSEPDIMKNNVLRTRFLQRQNTELTRKLDEANAEIQRLLSEREEHVRQTVKKEKGKTRYQKKQNKTVEKPVSAAPQSELAAPKFLPYDGFMPSIRILPLPDACIRH